MVSKHIESLIRHPDLYVTRQITPVIKSNNMTAEIVWTYLVARKYENDQQTLVKKLCGQNENYRKIRRYGSKRTSTPQEYNRWNLNIGEAGLIFQWDTSNSLKIVNTRLGLTETGFVSVNLNGSTIYIIMQDSLQSFNFLK